MAGKDRKTWLNLFYNRWSYEPVSALRKKHEYSGKIPLTEALEKASDYNIQFLIQVIFPFEKRPPFSDKTSDSIVIFPQTIYDNKNNIYEIDKPILYDGISYSLDNFISKSPSLVPYNAEDMFGTYAFSLPFFTLTPNEIRNFSRLYLTPVKSKIIKTEFYPEARGKKKIYPIIAERNEFIISEYKKICRIKPLPAKNIERAVAEKAEEYYRKGDELKEKLYDNCDRVIINRVIREYKDKCS